VKGRMPEHRTKPEHGEQTRGVILAAARRAFAERGYAGTALEDVCAAAGVTRGALYHHYAGKAGVFRAGCEALAAEVATAVAAPARAARTRRRLLRGRPPAGPPAPWQ